MSEQDQIPVSAPNVRPSQVEQSAAPSMVNESMNPAAAKETVVREVSSWNGVTVGEHRFGGVEFRIGRRELGHLHATIADLPFPKRIRDELVAAGKARPHHVIPNSGWITVSMRTASEVTGVIELFRQNYERATNVHR
jgi:hypothetical protein